MPWSTGDVEPTHFKKRLPLPGKSSFNVSFVCPVRPEDPGGSQVPESYGPVPGGYTLSTDVGCDSGDWPAF